VRAVYGSRAAVWGSMGSSDRGGGGKETGGAGGAGGGGGGSATAAGAEDGGAAAPVIGLFCDMLRRVSRDLRAAELSGELGALQVQLQLY